MTRKKIDTLILDLDNTIFDWFAVWYASFHPVYEAVLAKSGRPATEVEADIRRVHQAQRTSEYTFLLEELESLQELRKQGDIRTQFRDALQAAAAGRDQQLKLYPSVFRSLWAIKNSGTRIVAYTESMRFYSSYRLKRFGLDGVIDVLFSPQDHDVPAGVSPEKLRRLPDDFYELQVTGIKHTPAGELKPNPKVLLDIIKDVGSDPVRCAYVGDNLLKDVAMARDANVFDIHAKYGESQRLPEYKLLQRVSHWPEKDVQREQKITEAGQGFEPSAVLHECFAEIFAYCEFVAPTAAAVGQTQEDEVKNALEIWKKTIDIQQHFNDLEMRIRNFAITVVGALVAAVGFTYQYNLETMIAGYRIPTGIGFIAAAIFAWSGFFLMDRYWYHILLRGAVAHAGIIEKQFADRIPGIGLGQSISQASGDVRFLGIKMNSNRRLTAFYVAGFLMLAVVLVSLLWAQPRISAPPKPAQAVQAPASQTVPPVDMPTGQPQR
ncbi:MAG TPA: HAD family hydrolase [Beijerinckiaceae bacterium]|jgi:phosphoglycolate phosphatase-like HAD superfamily hydrolase